MYVRAFQNQKTFSYLLMFSCLAVFLLSCKENSKEEPAAPELEFALNNAGLSLPEGFKVIIAADSLKNPRHIAVTDNGSIYAKLRELDDDNGVVFLEDTDQDGIMDRQEGFGNYAGTGIGISQGYLYASSDEAVMRYTLDEDQKVTNKTAPDTIVSGLLNKRQHASKSLTLDGAGNIYVNIGAPSNACQETDRTLGSPGMMPCPILDSAGGVWQFRTDKLLQTFGDGKLYATGLRNVIGLDWNHTDQSLYVTQHGRDQLNTLYPDLYDVKANADLPAETLYRVEEGDDAGWPYVYYDQNQQKKILSPEYGGDGQKTGGEDALDPLVAFPAHLAPNALLFYSGDQFPERYKNGAFIAFHGSWNRAPEIQEGYNVVFVPFQNGKPTGEWEVFAEGFAGVDEVRSPRDAAHRPTGLAQGPDGSIYVSDDSGGTIYRIVYDGE
ncbi:sorbosone dehydrogenase [Flavobacteriaceae bacterium R33]|uniref:Sorbosone dehydrogenase n=2 Tax=Poritiphilus flavus TaxID=2697053 RepID=A0A6L9EDZ4_9FLAO|nr:sorbosone dehydrogenase [Poritiphilus flavus]